MPRLQLAPGPAAARRPGGPGDRPAAVRRGARPADHLPARARRPAAAGRRHAVRRPDQPARHARPLRHPAAARQRRRRWTSSAWAAGRCPRPRPAQAWRLLCAHWDVFRGTPVPLLAGERAGRHLRRHRAARRRRPPTRSTTRSPSGWPTGRYRPRALLRAVRHRGAGHHRRPVRRPVRARRARAPTRRWSGPGGPDLPPDRYLEPAQPGWRGRWSTRSAPPPTSTPATTPATSRRWRTRRRYFIAHGAVSADHSHADVRTDPLEPAEADRIYAAALAGDGHRRRRRRRSAGTCCWRWPGCPCDDGLVMTLHPGVHRNHHGPTTGRVRRRTPATTSRSRSSSPTRCSPLLERYGTHPGLPPGAVHPRRDRVLPGDRAAGRLLPGVYAGAPWWFLDAPEAIRRFRAAVTETAGFSRTSGFIDDTRAFCSIPARHDMSRRLDAGYLAQLVAEHRLDEDEASTTAHDLVADQPARGVQAVTAHRPGGCPVARRRRPPRRAGADRPPRARQLLPRPPGLVHRARPGRRGVGHRRVHRPPRRSSPTRSTAQDGLYTLITRAADGDRFEVREQPVRGPSRRRPRRLAGLPRPPGGRAW